ncbi:MAG: hypothetical protein D6694_12475, partial [Gammaproteobacteria bacterium]
EAACDGNTGTTCAKQETAKDIKAKDVKRIHIDKTTGKVTVVKKDGSTVEVGQFVKRGISAGATVISGSRDVISGGAWKGVFKPDNTDASQMARQGQRVQQADIGNSPRQKSNSIDVKGASGFRNRRPQTVRHKFVTKTGKGMGWNKREDAVKAFYAENEALYQSAKKNREILVFLVKGSDNKYYYTDAIVVRDEYKFSGSIVDADGNEISEIRSSGPIKGVLHSHPGGNFGNQEGFSEKDWRVADRGLDYYVRTPKGDIRYINSTISSGQDADKYRMKPGISLCNPLPCLKPYGAE